MKVTSYLFTCVVLSGTAKNTVGFIVRTCCSARHQHWTLSSTAHKESTKANPSILPKQGAPPESDTKEIDTTSSPQDPLLERNTQLVRWIKHILFDVLYAGPTLDRAYARFYALETIARMPYFSYLSVLHLLETLGRWRQADRLALHFAESWNELHHLLIMEDLLSTKSPSGSHNRNNDEEVPFRDRFIAQHLAVFYYWFVVFLYFFDPNMAYSLNQAVEQEAYETYDQFLQTHKDYLKSQPAPQVAIDYYTGSGMPLFDIMHHDRLAAEGVNGGDLVPPRRRVVCETLYDCFVAIRDDELEHSETMASLQLPQID